MKNMELEAIESFIWLLPGSFGPVVERIDSAGLALNKGDSWQRVVIEKPLVKI